MSSLPDPISPAPKGIGTVPRTEPKLDEPLEMHSGKPLVPHNKLRREPANTECPNCHYKGMSRIEKDGSWLGSFANVMCSMCVTLCSQVPQAYGRRNMIHYCTNCGQQIGKASGLINSGTTGAAAPFVAAA